MEQILDTAEHLFSKHGFYGVTLKDVAKRVGVHHTLVNYYFDDKKTLFDAVFARRAIVTIEKRMKALDDYDRAAGGNPTVEGRSEEHTSELQSLMRISYAVFCLKKKKENILIHQNTNK